MTIFQKTTRIAAMILMFVINGLAVWQPLFGIETYEISDQFHTLITPIGLTFSIWSLIYLGQLFVAGLIATNKVVLNTTTRGAYLISCLANSLRLVVRHQVNLHRSFLVMIVLLVSLVVVVQSLTDQISTSDTPTLKRVRLSFLVYLGWIIIATLVMTTVYLQYEWLLLADYGVVAAYVALGLAVVVNSVLMWRYQTIVTALVALWALYGIWQAETMDSSFPIVLAAGLLVIHAIWTMVSLIRTKRCPLCA